MNKCKTCDEIKFWRTYKKVSPEFQDKLYSKISIYTFKKGKRKIPGNEKGSITSQAFNLNYCPTCGRKIGSDNND